ncbi:MAG: hypothetical protein K2M60_08810 [Lachnospiraceae bacterium]|nr:hypothetical protein [Lachnospiraceae bacterium]MDE6254176.1 hypothetical protein [Lachnospiraceae bacterium]
MRKILFLTVIAVMTVSCTACGGSKAKEKKADTEVKTETETEEGLFNWNDNFYSQFEGSEYTECTDAEGKTVEELTEAGYSYTGYAGVGKQYYFTFTDDDYDYSVILDDSATDIMEKKDFGMSNDEILEMLKDCVVEKCYSKESEGMDMDSSRYKIYYPEFEGKTIGELAEGGYMIDTYIGMGNDYQFFIDGADGEKYVVTLDDSFSDKMEELDVFMSDEEMQELLKDCVIKTCFKK